MAITEKQLSEALGVGVQVQEPADPAAQPSTIDSNQPAGTEPVQEGAQAQEPADPAEVDTDPVPRDGTQTEPTTGNVDDDDADTGAEGDKQTLTPEQRRANAARRRQQEQQAAIDAAVAEAVKQEKDRNAAATDAFFKQLNIRNPYTNELITNMEQFTAWQEKVREEKLANGFKSGKLTPELIDDVISRHPVVQKAQDLIEKSADDAKKAQQEAMEARVKAEMEEISKLDPSIKSVADLKNMPNFPQFYELVGKNYSFLDAYRIVNFEKLTAAAADVGRQQAVSNARSKDHLQATGNSRGGGAAAVPQSEMAMYRLMNPDATEAQIQAHYNKNKPK